MSLHIKAYMALALLAIAYDCSNAQGGRQLPDAVKEKIRLISQCIQSSIQKSGLTVQTEEKIHEAARQCHHSSDPEVINPTPGKVPTVNDIPSIEQLKANIPETEQCIQKNSPELLDDAKKLFEQISLC